MLCQKAEHDFALAPVGIMDMTTVISAQPGHAMLLDCRSLSKQFIPLDPKELGVVIVNSMVKHNLSTSEYGVRRKQCEEGAAILKQDHPAIKALRDVTLKQLETAQGQLSETVYRRCRHVITENQRTADAAAFLLKKQYEQAGALMKQSHDSLKNDYEVSCPELDFLVDQTKAVKGVYGARMTGGGFGGCIVALVQPGAVEALAAHLTHAYASAFKTTPTIIVTPPAAGASVIE
jgi:galactokinase